jgi:hypothetical protein
MKIKGLTDKNDYEKIRKNIINTIPVTTTEPPYLSKYPTFFVILFMYDPNVFGILSII